MKPALFIFLSLALLSSCSTKYGISNASAYYKKTVAGTVRVDDNGRPMSSGVSEQHFIFIETDPAKPFPAFSTAWVGQTPFAVQVKEVDRPDQVVGKTVNGEEVRLSPKQGHKVWQLLITEQPSMPLQDTVVKEKLGKNKVVLTGTWKGKPFSYGIAKEEQLETAFYQ